MRQRFSARRVAFVVASAAIASVLVVCALALVAPASGPPAARQVVSSRQLTAEANGRAVATALSGGTGARVHAAVPEPRGLIAIAMIAAGSTLR